MKSVIVIAALFVSGSAWAQGMPATVAPGVPLKQQENLITLPPPMKDSGFTIASPQPKVPTELGVAVPVLNPPKL